MSKKRDYTAIWGLINAVKGPLDGEELKCDLVTSITEGRTSSLREMTSQELTRLRVRLRAMVREMTPKDKSRTRHRSMCLHLMEEYGIDVKDWTRINAFCEEPRIAGKPFGQLSSMELQALSRKLRAMLRKREETKEPAPEKRQATPQLRGKYYLMRIPGTKKVNNVN